MNQVYPVIVVPGITATNLRDAYAMSPDVVWSVLTKRYEQLTLHPDNPVYEASEPARVVPDQLFGITYREMIGELRFNLREREDLPVPVYPFGYDWRQPLAATERQLEAFIGEVIERTQLMKHYHAPWFLDHPKVNLVGHSMGGMIIAGYLERNRGGNRVHKVVTLATPFRGSFEALIKIATGTANLGTPEPSSREREAARMMPALYHLLPTCEGVRLAEGVAGDLFDPTVWQASIVGSLKEFVRLRGVSQEDPATQAATLFAGLLATAKEYRNRIEGFRLRDAGLTPGDWLCIAGVDAETRVGVSIEKDASGPCFNLSGKDRVNNWDSKEGDVQRMLTGDGTVPLKGALPGFLEPEHVVCLSPDDFGYWEVKDRATVKLAGFHGLLPNMNLIHRLIVRHFTGRPDVYHNTWGRAVPGVVEWDPPFRLSLKSNG